MTWQEFEAMCTTCQRCSLCKTRKNSVIGKGNINADIMFVGEAPGEQEDLRGKPFVGLAGQLLDKYFLALDIPLDSIYVCNILKCRPPRNRDPLPEESNACMHLLREQVRLVKPKVIICLGRIAAQMLIHPDFRITAEHGKWFEKGKFYMCAVYHPSALLRDPGKLEDMYKDMENIKTFCQKIGLISDSH